MQDESDVAVTSSSKILQAMRRTALERTRRRKGNIDVIRNKTGTVRIMRSFRTPVSNARDNRRALKIESQCAACRFHSSPTDLETLLVKSVHENDANIMASIFCLALLSEHRVAQELFALRQSRPYAAHGLEPWNKFGCNVSEDIIKSMADEVVKSRTDAG